MLLLVKNTTTKVNTHEIANEDVSQRIYNILDSLTFK